jgi:hypothetical protein
MTPLGSIILIGRKDLAAAFFSLSEIMARNSHRFRSCSAQNQLYVGRRQALDCSVREPYAHGWSRSHPLSVSSRNPLTRILDGIPRCSAPYAAQRGRRKRVKYEPSTRGSLTEVSWAALHAANCFQFVSTLKRLTIGIRVGGIISAVFLQFFCLTQVLNLLAIFRQSVGRRFVSAAASSLASQLCTKIHI